MTPAIVVRPAAEAEISEAFQWYEDKSIGLGSEFMRVLDASLSAIQRFPTSYAVVHKEIRRAVLAGSPTAFTAFMRTILSLSLSVSTEAATLGSGRIGQKDNRE